MSPFATFPVSCSSTLHPCVPYPAALFCVLTRSAAPSLPPLHLSSLHLSATNHNLFTTPRAHSTTLLAPIADLFIPDNAEGWRLWFETRIAQRISHSLTRWAPHSLGLIDVILRAERSCLEKQNVTEVALFFIFWRRAKRQRTGFTVSLAAGCDERQQVAHLLMMENSCGRFIGLWERAAWTSLSFSLSESYQSKTGSETARRPPKKEKSEKTQTDLGQSREREQVRRGVGERVEVQQVLFFWMQAPTCRCLNDITERSAAPRANRKETAETQHVRSRAGRRVKPRCGTCRSPLRPGFKLSVSDLAIWDDAQIEDGEGFNAKMRSVE